MFSSPMTRAWQPAKPAIIRVGDEYQARVPEFDEEVKRAIVDNLEHFTEKETQMLGVRFWPPNNDMNNNNNTGSPTRKSPRRRSKSREPVEEEENAAKHLALSENDKKKIEVIGVATGGGRETAGITTKATAEAGIDSNDASAAAAVAVKTETVGEEVKDRTYAFIRRGGEELFGIVRVPREYSRSAHNKREIGFFTCSSIVRFS